MYRDNDERPGAATTPAASTPAASARATAPGRHATGTLHVEDLLADRDGSSDLGRHGRAVPADTSRPAPPPAPPTSDRNGTGGGTGGGGGDDEDGTPDPNRWKALAVCLIGGFMVLLDVSIVNVALKSIAQSSALHATGDEIQWVLSGYALTFGLLLVPAGRLGDVRGRRRMFVIGLVLFTLTSAACGAAQSGMWLVVARLAQGLAGGLLTPQISALIQQLFSGRERGKAFGLFGAVVGISTAIGPLLGGLLITAFGETDGWRYVFFVNLPIGVVAVLLAFRYLPGASTDQRGHKHDYDPMGVVLLGTGVVVLLLPFVQEQQWTGSTKWLLVPLGLLLLGGFVAWEFRYRRRGREAMVDLALFNRRSFSFGTSMITLYFAGFTPLFFVLTLLLQSGLGYSALLAGTASLPFAIGSGIAATLGGRIVHRFGRVLVAGGLVLVVIGFAGVVLAVHEVTSRSLGWALLLPLLVGGIGSGLVISPNQTLTLSQVPRRQGGTAGGMIQVGQRIGSAVGIAAVGSVFYARLTAGHGDYPGALQRGLFVALGFLVAALVLAVVDVTVDHRRQAAEGGNPSDGGAGAPAVADTATPALSEPSPRGEVVGAGR